MALKTEADHGRSPIAARLLKDSSVYLAVNVASKIIGFAMIPFYARFLSTDQYGILNLIELATTVVAIAFGLQSIGQSLTRIYHDQDDENVRRAVVSTALMATILIAGGTAAIGMVTAPSIAEAINLSGQASLLRMAFLAMFFGSVAEVVLVYERMHNRVGFFAIYAIVTLFLTLSLNIVLIGWWHLGVWGFVYSKLAVAGPACILLLARTAWEVGVAWRSQIAAALARFGGPLVVSGVCYFGIHFSDRLFLAHVSRAEVGVYSLAYNFAFLLSILIGDSFNKSWGVSFYSYASGAGWQERFAQVGRWLVFVLGAGAIGISLFGRDVLILMVPASYQPPMLLLPLLVFGYFLREVGDFFNSMLLIGAGSGLVGRIAVAGALVNLALNAWLIPRFGIWGAAWATFGTWTAYCAACWFSAWRAHRVAMHPWPLAFILLLSAGCLAARAVTAPAGPVTALALDSAAFAVFLAVAVLFYLKSAERAEAVGLVNRALAGLRKVAGT